jgi:cytochrome P450
MTTTAQRPNPAAQVAEEPFPYRRACPFMPPDQYDYLSHGEPAEQDAPDRGRESTSVKRVLLATGRKAWAVTGYDNIRAVLTNPNVSSSRRHDGFPFYFDAPAEFRTETSFIGYDPPEHTNTRRKAALTFTTRNVNSLRPRIQEIVDGAIDRMLEQGPPVDLHTSLALPVPMAMICQLLGVPFEDEAFFQRLGQTLLGGKSTAEDRANGIREATEYFTKLVAKKEQEPGDDLISRTIKDYQDNEEEYDPRAVVNMCRLLMNGGHETSANMISLGTACLLENPDQLELLKSDPELLVPAVEELLRYLTIGDTAVPRVALEDIEVDGAVIPKGDGILMIGLTGNRDPNVYEEPDKLDIRRGSRKHLAFGHGLHHCIGSELARTELEIVFSTLFRRIPDLKLAEPFDSLGTKHAAVIYGLWNLPVTW